MTATLTRIRPAGLTDRQLIAAMARALREAGWGPDLRIPALWRSSRWLDDHNGIAWTDHSIEICRRIGRDDDVTEALVTSVQQAIDVVAALTGVGVHLTTGARRWGQ